MGALDDITEKTINISEINWNQMSSAEFRELERKIQEDRKNIKRKKQHKSKGKPKTEVFIKIKGETFKIKLSLYDRLKNMTSEKSKEKLLKEIRETHQPIIEI